MHKDKNRVHLSVFNTLISLSITILIAISIIYISKGLLIDCKISLYNQKAEIVFSSIMTTLNSDFKEENDISCIKITNAQKGKSAVKAVSDTGLETEDLRQKLGKDFYGSATIYLDKSGKKIKYVLWNNSGEAPVGDAFIDYNSQKSDWPDVKGCYPVL